MEIPPSKNTPGFKQCNGKNEPQVRGNDNTIIVQVSFHFFSHLYETGSAYWASYQKMKHIQKTMKYNKTNYHNKQKMKHNHQTMKHKYQKQQKIRQNSKQTLQEDTPTPNAYETPELETNEQPFITVTRRKKKPNWNPENHITWT